MGLGIFIKMTLGVVRKEFGLHGWRAKHPTWGTTKGLCKAASPSPKQSCPAFPPLLSAVVHGDTWKVGIKRHLSRGWREEAGGWREGTSKTACFLELLKTKYLEANMRLVWSGIVFN